MNKVNNIDDTIEKIRKASQKVAIQRLKNEALKIELNYRFAFGKVIQKWKHQFINYYNRNNKLMFPFLYYFTKCKNGNINLLIITIEII